MGAGCPRAFSLTCVESNLKIKLTFAVPVRGVVSVVFWQELNNNMTDAITGIKGIFIVGCFWLGKVGVDAFLQQL